MAFTSDCTPGVQRKASTDSGVIVKEFRNRFGAIIANGQGSMKGQIFRIAHLGYFDFADLFSVIAGLEIILEANGHPVRFGSGVGRSILVDFWFDIVEEMIRDDN